MKKIIYIFAFSMFFSAFSLNAQQVQIPDGSFQDYWKMVYGDIQNYWDYETGYFITLNALSNVTVLGNPGELTAFRDGIGVDPGWCIKLVSGKVPLGDPIFLPGLVGTLAKNYVETFLEDRTVGITQYWDNDTPHALEGYYKYFPSGQDSASIDIGFSSYGEGFVEKLIIKGEQKYWKKFVIPIPEKYRDEFYKDIRILFLASAGVNFDDFDQCKGQYGSTLYVDSISLNYNYENGIKQSVFSTLKANAFPNPVSDVLNIELNESFTGTVAVYNMTGSLIMEEKINGTQCQLITSNLAAGNYMYRLMKDNTFFAQGKFVVTK